MERKWNEKGDSITSNCDKNVQNWAYCANQVISNVGEDIIQFVVERNDLICKIGLFVR